MFLFIIAEPDEAAEEIIRRYRGMMLHLASMMLEDHHLAEDVAQECTLKLLDNLHLIDEYDSVRTKNLVFTITKNIAVNEINKRDSKFRQVVSQDAQNTNSYEPHIDFKAFEDRYGFSEEMQELLSYLDETDQDIIRLKFGAGYQDREIADLLDMTLSNVKKRYQRARQKLIEILKSKVVMDDELRETSGSAAVCPR